MSDNTNAADKAIVTDNILPIIDFKAVNLTKAKLVLEGAPLIDPSAPRL